MTRYGANLPGTRILRVAPCLLVTVWWVAAGCSAATRTVLPAEERPLPTLDASRDDLLQEIAGLQVGISTLTGTAVRYTARSFGLTTGVLAEYRETEGALLVERPDHIRMRGSAPLGVTAFDMVSDRETFQVWLPTKGQFISGDADVLTCSEDPIRNLRPQHIMDALFIDAGARLGNPGVGNILEEVSEGRRSFYVLSFVDLGTAPVELLEKVWIDRLDLSVARKQLFRAEGVLHTDVTYGNWEETGGHFFPRRIVVERPVEDYSLEIQFDEVKINDTPVEGAFVLTAPDGAERILVESESGDCQG